MSLRSNLENDLDRILGTPWTIRNGSVVPQTRDILLAGGAVRLSATLLFADLADSSGLASRGDRRTAAKVFKCYSACAARLVRARNGEIRSYDGDRVMGVFLGATKNSDAVRCALNLNFVFTEMLKPRLRQRYPKALKGQPLAHAVGIDTGDVLVVRGGVHRSNDLIWVGRAPNAAAKLSDIRQSPYQTFITPEVYDDLGPNLTHGDHGEPLWERKAWSGFKGVSRLYRSEWGIEP